MKSSRDLALDLAEKADHDLRMAESGLAHGAPLDTVAFHVQQTAEKILKALLASRDIEYPPPPRLPRAKWSQFTHSIP